MEEEIETYAEVETAENYYEDEDLTFSDVTFLIGLIIAVCLVIGFILKQIKSTFKNVHLKVGNKFEVGVETKEDKPSDRKKEENNKKEEEKDKKE